MWDRQGNIKALQNTRSCAYISTTTKIIPLQTRRGGYLGQAAGITWNTRTLGEVRSWLMQKNTRSAKHCRASGLVHRSNSSLAHSDRRPSRLCTRVVGEAAPRRVGRPTLLGTVMQYCSSQSHAGRLFLYRFFKRITHRGSDTHCLHAIQGNNEDKRLGSPKIHRSINKCIVRSIYQQEVQSTVRSLGLGLELGLGLGLGLGLVGLGFALGFGFALGLGGGRTACGRWRALTSPQHT